MNSPSSVKVKKVADYIVDYVQESHEFTIEQRQKYQAEIQIQILRLLVDSKDNTEQGGNK